MPGVSVLATRSRAPVVPVWTQGSTRGTGVVRSLFQPSRRVVVFGEPFHVDGAEDRETVARAIQHRVEALRHEAPTS